MTTIVAFDRKGELTECGFLSQRGLLIFELFWYDCLIALLQPVPGVPLQAAIASIVTLLADHLGLKASRRLMAETLPLLYQRSRPRGQWPILKEWIALIDNIRVNAASRLGEYRHTVSYGLKAIDAELGGVLNYAASDFFERVFAPSDRNRCLVIRTDNLSVEMAALLASLFIDWIYERRGVAPAERDHRVIFLLDDALPLARGSTALETEGGNPVATWTFMGRSRGLGFVIAAQNFSLISPAIRNNADTILAFSSYARDAEELSRHLGLTREQAAVLPVVRPGEVVAIARSTWPLPVRGHVPQVP